MGQKKKKTPLFKALLERGIAGSEKEAIALIMGHYIIVNDHKVSEKNKLILESDLIRSNYHNKRFVSRSGEKLQGALDYFKIKPTGYLALDIGISTGGFTDCLLQNGAAHVIGVDVSYGLTDLSLQSNTQVSLIERQNARELNKDILTIALNNTPFSIEDIQLLVMDVSFISIRKILPVLSQLLPKRTQYLSLIKPQFECPKEEVPKGGIISDKNHRQQILDQVEKDLVAEQFSILGKCDSQLKGSKGNTEAFFLMGYG